ncbi:hypothetical protein [Salegentibacter sediminis]|uniref:hypothetical protein n=1 Tax=Salegentibacter sediminis TaxID=1930251 RepID=UPI0009BD15C1|nr:hypothetical protein [Salegentibacter sediminis]
MESKFNFRLAILLCLVLSTGTLSAQKSGSEIYEQIRLLDFEEREALISKELLSGNFPEFLLDWEEIITIQKDASGQTRKLSLFVSPDYLSVGNIEDYFIIPISPMTAQKVANKYNASPPTPKVTDIIYRHAELKIEPFNYIPRNNRNETVDIFYDHSQVIQAQIKAAGFSAGSFVAGSKKDIVISHKLSDSTRSRHVSIYGWHKLNGKPIQPLYNGHINTYVDYSHGARLISNHVLVDGKEYDYRDILQDKNLFKLISDEKEALAKTTYAH